MIQQSFKRLNLQFYNDSAQLNTKRWFKIVGGVTAREENVLKQEKIGYLSAWGKMSFCLSHVVQMQVALSRIKKDCFITGETKGSRDNQNCKNSDYFQNKGSRFGWLALEQISEIKASTVFP